jgi:hypothetical protein
VDRSRLGGSPSSSSENRSIVSILSIYRILQILLPAALPPICAYQDMVTLAVLGPLPHLSRVIVGADLGPLFD